MTNPTTTRSAVSLFAASIFAAVLGTTSATAQSLEADVVRDTTNDTVVYTLDLDGPPRGSMFVFAGYGLLPNPVPLPFGPLYLDPLASLSLGSIALDATGKGSMRLAIPSRLVNGDMIYFQGLAMDRGILRLTQNFRSCVWHETPVDDTLTTALVHNPAKQVYTGEFRGKEGAGVEIVHYRGGQIDIWRGIIPKGGVLKVCFQYQNKQKHRDTMEIRYNGESVKTWRR